MGAVDDYLDTLDDPAAQAYRHVRDLVVAEYPDAEQGTSYGMAAFLYRGKPLLGLRAARDHLSVFPFSPQAVAAVQERLTGTAVSKGTLRFTADDPLPDDVVRDLLRARADEIGASASGRRRS